MFLKSVNIICLISVIFVPKKAVLLSLGSENIQNSSLLRSPESHTQIQSLDKGPGLQLNEEEMLKFKIWPKGTIPYFIDDFSFDKVLRDKIRVYLDEINTQTGLQFMELPRPPDDENSRWVMFINRRGALNCVDHNSENFTNDGVQKIVLGYDCLENGGALAAAVLALVGVPPQHNSPDRDSYIVIQEKNILPDKKYLFKALTDKDWLFNGIDYDFSSAGHYDFHKYTSNGANTIEPKKEIEVSVSEPQGLSLGDILKIRMLYSGIIKNKTNKSKHCSKMFIMGSEFDTNKKMKQSQEKQYDESFEADNEENQEKSKSSGESKPSANKESEINLSLSNSNKDANDFDGEKNNLEKNLRLKTEDRYKSKTKSKGKGKDIEEGPKSAAISIIY